MICELLWCSVSALGAVISERAFFDAEKSESCLCTPSVVPQRKTRSFGVRCIPPIPRLGGVGRRDLISNGQVLKSYLLEIVFLSILSVVPPSAWIGPVLFNGMIPQLRLFIRY
jgi:hypothetical protein